MSSISLHASSQNLQSRSTGDTTCKGTSLDWYTSVVGVTPCRTYEMLRQICDATYTVGALSPQTPPDVCDSQVFDCCCNSIAFALSMLCLNCQQGVGSGVGGDTGIDAGDGAYGDYLSNFGQRQCFPQVNQSLPTAIQAGVCNEKIKIDDDLYTLFWPTGSWFYIYTKDTLQKNFVVNNNNIFTHCASTTLDNTTTTSAPPTTSSTSSTTPKPGLKTGAEVGIILAAILGGAALVAASIYYYRRRKYTRRRPEIFIDDDFEEGDAMIDNDAHVIEQFHLSPVPPPKESSSAMSPFSDVHAVGESSRNPSLLQSSSSPSPSLFQSPFQSPSHSPSQSPSHSASYSPAASTSASPAAASFNAATEPRPGALKLTNESHYSEMATAELPNNKDWRPEQIDRSLSPAEADRHQDAGPVDAQLGRSASGRLPPAYGQLMR
ncbi:hypothetical protein SISNIDRAFT_483092 [Sistotremastrum niveocremeum HHB9708]|uniref:Mid2 domain-containing protein n=1 Tax=Sistotremastrum niveocremeum HHB9708 TaxID=1314777 RepID=A0A164Y395_9AGAM|nr:hypothetical protein SISNIDRAFT_483092 [Sistotremastrum niveocremeum HHB9708]